MPACHSLRGGWGGLYVKGGASGANREKVLAEDNTGGYTAGEYNSVRMSLILLSYKSEDGKKGKVCVCVHNKIIRVGCWKPLKEGLCVPPVMLRRGCCLPWLEET